MDWIHTGWSLVLAFCDLDPLSDLYNISVFPSPYDIVAIRLNKPNV